MVGIECIFIYKILLFIDFFILYAKIYRVDNLKWTIKDCYDRYALPFEYDGR